MLRKVIGTVAVLVWIAALASAQLTDSIIEPESSGDWLSGRVHRPRRSAEPQAAERRSPARVRGAHRLSEKPARRARHADRIADRRSSPGPACSRGSSTRSNPRTIFFNDSTAVAWMAGGLIEVASLDPRQGAIFYLLPQQATPPLRQLARDTRCLQCHYSTATLGVPGFLVRSIPSSPNGMIMPWLGNYTTDHRSPLTERWGGWYVTGRGGRHLGNAPIADRTLQDVRIDESNLNVTTLADRFDTQCLPLAAQRHRRAAGLRSSDADDESAHAARLGSQNRRARRHAPTRRRCSDVVDEVVDYMLFVDEAPLDGVRGHVGIRRDASARWDRATARGDRCAISTCSAGCSGIRAAT